MRLMRPAKLSSASWRKSHLGDCHGGVGGLQRLQVTACDEAELFLTYEQPNVRIEAMPFWHNIAG